VIACLGVALAAQAPDKQLVATITAPTLAGGIVSGLLWDGGTLIIQTAAMENGALAARYFVAAGPGIELRRLAAAPPSVGPYWKMKSARVSPTGLGKIKTHGDSKLPMYGVSSQEKRLADAMDLGGAIVTFELQVGDLVLNRRRDVEPFDGEVWSWSPPELNRIAYVDEKGDLWVAEADGRHSERLAKGKFMLPAWSVDGRAIAVVERKEDGAKWEVSVVHLPEKYRR
jgi:hypothetical protein